MCWELTVHWVTGSGPHTHTFCIVRSPLGVSTDGEEREWRTTLTGEITTAAVIVQDFREHCGGSGLGGLERSRRTLEIIRSVDHIGTGSEVEGGRQGWLLGRWLRWSGFYSDLLRSVTFPLFWTLEIIKIIT